MKLIPHHQGDKHGHREYRSPDGTWKVVRTRRSGGNRNERPRWEVHERHELNHPVNKYDFFYVVHCPYGAFVHFRWRLSDDRMLLF